MIDSAASPPLAAVADLNSAAGHGAEGWHKFRSVAQEKEQKKSMLMCMSGRPWIDHGVLFVLTIMILGTRQVPQHKLISNRHPPVAAWAQVVTAEMPELFKMI